MISPSFGPGAKGARPGGMWDYVSASRLSTWLACPLKFKLKYLDGVPSISSPAMLVGKAVHAGLECFYRHRQLGMALSSDEVVGRMESLWEELLAQNEALNEAPAPALELRSQAASLVQAYLAQLPQSEPAPMAVEVAAEASLVDPQTGGEFGHSAGGHPGSGLARCQRARHRGF